ncbi:hypothetical protein FQN60_002972 [Etheostoma spectabile]|uniref:PDZ domain-containing protein n=1 Tax=Etheostoma spectabile TaxID=54343 RepID=A0A5J5CN53_9PERO|nr:hypothetical protein FQN60_002972 [Etheostoma spectabile]
MSTYTVTLNGPAPWGFRLQGGKDFNMPLTISRITPGSKAVGGSLAQGDIISAIDGVSTEGMTHMEAQNKIKSATTKLSLTMQKSRRAAAFSTPRMDSPMPVIPHQKELEQIKEEVGPKHCGEEVQMEQPLSYEVLQDKKPSKGNLFQVPKKDPELLSTLTKAPASSTPFSISTPGQRGQYNSPVGLYSPETVTEMMLMQGKLGQRSAASREVSSLGLSQTQPQIPCLSFSAFSVVSLLKNSPLFPMSVNLSSSHLHLKHPHLLFTDPLTPNPPPDTDSVEYTPSFNPIALKDSALSTHKPIEVRGPGGKATIVHAQYNTPISMYSQDAIMDAIAGQSQAKGHDSEEAGSPLSGALPIKDSVVDCASPVYQAVIRPGETNQDMSEWARRAANLQSKSFRMLAHITGTEYRQYTDSSLPPFVLEKFESEVKGPRFAKLKNWHHGLSAQILNVQE